MTLLSAHKLWMNQTIKAVRKTTSFSYGRNQKPSILNFYINTKLTLVADSSLKLNKMLPTYLRGLALEKQVQNCSGNSCSEGWL